MYTITNNTEFIIGIDFGHGETSARFYDLRNQDAKDLDILPGLKVVKSAVAVLEQEGNETICVGDSAIQQAPRAKDFQVSFKKRPSEMNPEERKRMVFFMKGIYDGILERHPDYKNREHGVFIARPSQDSLWKKEEQAYIAIAEDAGIPVAGIQKESRAAYFRARTQSDSKIDQYIEKGVLIVDFGSSTIDFTYLNKSLTQPIDDGADLGASAVEEALLKYALSHPMDITMPDFNRLYGDKTTSNAYNQMLYQFRVAKEEFYGKKLPNFSVAIDYSPITSAEDEQLTGFGGIRLSKDEVKSILRDEQYGAYIPRIEAAVKKFKNEKLKNQEVAYVYLTGGASRMDFVCDVFMEVFNLDEEHCLPDDTPSLIVSQGVAHLSYADIKTTETEEGASGDAEEIIDNFDWEGKLKDTIVESVKKSIIDKVYDIMQDYKAGRIYDYHTLDNGFEGGRYYGPMEGGNNNGFQKVRNVESLIGKFESVFNGYVNYDFIPQCKSLIQENVIEAINRKLKEAFATFELKESIQKDIALTGLSAIMLKDGADRLKWRFTSGGEGHVLYDAVSSCYLMMWDWNIYKDRWNSDRQQHYEYYIQHYKNIFNFNSDWTDFINKYISICGIDKAKKQIKASVNEMIAEYISFAKLSQFF